MKKLLKTKKDREQFLTWISFLLAGVFRRGKETLNPVSNSYCCLGVGCLLTIPDRDLNIRDNKIKGAFPSDQIKSPEWLKRINEDFYERTDSCLISDLNDNGTSHKSIAKRLLKAYNDEL